MLVNRSLLYSSISSYIGGLTLRNVIRVSYKKQKEHKFSRPQMCANH